MIIEPSGSLGVVPIFVNAGTALAPLILAPLASVGAVIMRPKLLVALVKRKPWVPLVVLAVGGGIWFGVAHLFGGAPAAAASTRGGAADKAAPTVGYAKVDWQAEAFKLLQAERDAAKVAGVKFVWDYPPAKDAMVWSAPAYDPRTNRVVCTASFQDVATMYGVLYCVDAETGKRVWSVEQLGGADLKPFFSSPVLTPDGKSVLVGQGLHADADCALLCVDAETGALRWQVPTPLHIESSPAILGDLVVVGAGAIEDANHKPTTDPGYVFAVRISTGEQLWKHPVNDPESSPAIAPDGTVYIGSGFNGNAIVALRSESDADLKAKGLSRELWKVAAPFPMTGPITIDGDVVFAGGGKSDFVYADPNPAGVVMALDRRTGAPKWPAPAKLDESVLNRIVVRDGLVFCPVRSGSVVALSAADGHVVWRRPVNGKSPVLAGVAVSDDGATLFAASRDATLAVFEAKTGTLVETDPLNAPGKPTALGSFSTPTVVKNKLFVGSETGGLRCYVAVKP